MKYGRVVKIDKAGWGFVRPRSRWLARNGCLVSALGTGEDRRRQDRHESDLHNHDEARAHSN